MTAIARQPATVTSELRLIPLHELVPTPDNPRVLRDDAALAELAASIRANGLLQPVVARPMPPGLLERSVAQIRKRDRALADELTARGRYDLRAGHRRWEAARRAGLTAIPCIVRELDDKVAMEVTVAENLQRENLLPLEEANGVQRLLDVGWDVQAIADRLGKTPQWVARRAKLGDLAPPWRKALEDPKADVSTWPATLLDLVARLPATSQLVVLDNAGEIGGWNAPFPTAAELERWIGAHVLHTLAGAPWKLDDDTLVPKVGACAKCPKRSSCQPLLFDQDAEPAGRKKKAAGDRCLDQACYAAKGEAFAKRKLEELRRERPEAGPAIDGHLEYQARQAVEKRFPGAADVYPHMRAKAEAPGAKPVVIVAGEDVGKVVWVQDHGGGGSRRAKRSRPPGAPTPLKERRQALARRRMAQVVGAVRERIAALGERAELPAGVCGVERAAALALAFGTAHRFDRPEGSWRDDRRDPWKVLAACGKALGPDLARSVIRVLHGRLAFNNGEQAEKVYPDCKRICELLVIDVAALEAAAAAEIPEPKGWTHLNADGTPRGTAPAKRTKTAKPPADSSARAEKPAKKRARGKHK